ncbi:MAG: glycosyltransferase [Gemmataceae bacterium]|nr:glycosyltransferase [Gemmataceae bacterium]
MDPTEPRVTGVMITHNRGGEVLRTLEHIHRLPDRPRVILVDNGSSDGTPATVRERFPGVRVIEAGANLGAAGRNLGVAEAGTPYVAFFDDDSWPDPGCLRHAAGTFDTCPKLALLSGLVLVGPANHEDPICAEMEASPLPTEPGMPGPALLGFLAGASVVRRDAVLAAGGFEPRFQVGGEEEVLAADLVSAGWWVCYDRAYVVHHHPSPRRSPDRRRTTVVRNALWATWLRRSIPGAVRHTARLAASWEWDAATLRGVLAAVAGVPWVLRNRRVIPRHVDAALNLLTAAPRPPARPPVPRPAGG